MMHALVVREEAGSDIENAAIWYEQESPGLGIQFLGVVDSMFEHIVEAPLAYPMIDLDVRRAIMPRFPFLIYFMFDGRHVCIIAVLHGKRNPDEWKSRTKR